MLFKSATTLACLALASRAVAEPAPYKPSKPMMSVRDLFGISARESDGYTPTQTFCGTGNTCAEACGAGFETCSSTDNAIHCFNPTVADTCCSDGTGNSCEAGYYCTTDGSSGTFCCPDGQSLTECAKAYGVKGGLASETPLATSSSVAASSSSSASSSVLSSSASLISSSISAKASVASNSTVVVTTTGYTTTSCSTTSTAAVTGNFTKGAPTTTPTQVVVSGAARFFQPALAGTALVAAAFAMLL